MAVGGPAPGRVGSIARQTLWPLRTSCGVAGDSGSSSDSPARRRRSTRTSPSVGEDARGEARAEDRQALRRPVRPRYRAVPRELKLSELSPEVIGRRQAERVAAGAGRVACSRRWTHSAASCSVPSKVAGCRGTRVRVVRRIARPRRREVKPLAPKAVEAMRAAAHARNATLISVLAYAGLRPQGALALQWGHVRERTLLIQRAVSPARRRTRRPRRIERSGYCRHYARTCWPGGCVRDGRATRRSSSRVPPVGSGRK
jgi:integrase